MNIFYVYIYLDPRKPGKYIYDNYEFEYEPIYIGKGKGDRIYDHIYKCKGKEFIGKNKFYDKLRKILNLGYKPIKFKIKDSLFENDAFTLEKDLIKLIGRYNLNLGPLTNLTDGGDGASGKIYTDEERYQKGIHSRGKTKEEYYGLEKSKIIQEKINISVRKFHLENPDIYKGSNSSMYNKKHSLETKKKMSEFAKTRTGDKNASAKTIEVYNSNLEYIDTFTTVQAVSDNFKISRVSIGKVLNGTLEKTKGYIFKYKKNINCEKI